MIFDTNGLIYLPPDQYKRVFDAVEITSVLCNCGANIVHVKTDEARMLLSKPEYSCSKCEITLNKMER